MEDPHEVAIERLAFFSQLGNDRYRGGSEVAMETLLHRVSRAVTLPAKSLPPSGTVGCASGRRGNASGVVFDGDSVGVDPLRPREAGSSGGRVKVAEGVRKLSAAERL